MSDNGTLASAGTVNTGAGDTGTGDTGTGRPLSPLLAVENLSVRFGHGGTRVEAVRGVTFSIDPAETVALVGESGSGKSVTAKAVLRLLGPGASVAGTATFGGRDLLGLPERELRRLRGGQLSLIVQDALASLNPAHPVGSQIAEALRIHRRLGRNAAAAEAVELLARTGIREPRQVARRYPHQLSGGMRQRVVIASAIACQPQLIIADEPTTALDVTLQAQILALLGELARDEGTALLLITHDMGVVSHVADRVVVMYAGEIIETGTADDVLERPAHPYTAGLLGAVPGRVPPGRKLVSIPGQIPHPGAFPGGCSFHPCCAFAVDTCRVEHPALELVPGSGLVPGPGSRSGSGSGGLVLAERQRAAHEAACPVVMPGQLHAREVTLSAEPRLAPAQRTAASAPPLVRVRGLRKTFTARSVFGLAGPAVTAVDDVAFEIAPGTTMGLVGESGSGKSTTARLVARLIEPTAGTVELDGRDLTALSGEDLRRRRRDFQVIFQDTLGSLDPRRRIGSAIREPLRAFGETADRARVIELLDLVGLSPEYVNRAPYELSGGQRQRVVIARALALRPKLLICDEPVASLDVSIQAQVVNLLRDLQADLGLTCLFISHDLALVRHMCDHVAVMRDGQIVEQGPVEQVYESPAHPYTRELVAAVPGRSRASAFYDGSADKVSQPEGPA